MKKNIITAIILLSATMLNAQDKKMDKIADLYQKQDFENCIVAATIPTGRCGSR